MVLEQTTLSVSGNGALGRRRSTASSRTDDARLKRKGSDVFLDSASHAPSSGKRAKTSSRQSAVSSSRHPDEPPIAPRGLKQKTLDLLSSVPGRPSTSPMDLEPEPSPQTTPAVMQNGGDQSSDHSVPIARESSSTLRESKSFSGPDAPAAAAAAADEILQRKRAKGSAKEEKRRKMREEHVRRTHALKLSPGDPLAIIRTTKKEHLLLEHDLCDICSCAATPRNQLLCCTECGEVSHRSCAGIESIVLEHNHTAMQSWKCTECVRCTVCTTIGKEDQLLVCDWCQRGFHTYCHKPALKDIPETEKWLCHECSRCPVPYCKEAVRSEFWFEQVYSCSYSASSSLKGNGREGQLDLKPIQHSGKLDWSIPDCVYSMHAYWSKPVCDKCWQRYRNEQFCHVCLDVYDMDDYSLQMVCCDKCDHWIHIKCAGLSTRQYNALSRAAEASEEGIEEEEEFICPKCRCEPSAQPVLPSLSGGDIAVMRTDLAGQATPLKVTSQANGCHATADGVILRVEGVKNDTRPCSLCPEKAVKRSTSQKSLLSGRCLLPFGEGSQFSHLQCAALASGVSVGYGGELFGLGKAYKRSLKVQCCACGEPGPTIGCFRSTCKFIAHLSCLRASGARLFSTVTFSELSIQPYGNVAMLCSEHATCKASKKWIPLQSDCFGSLFDRIESDGLLDGKRERFEKLSERGPAFLRHGSLSVVSYGSLSGIQSEHLGRFATRHRVYPVGYKAFKRFTSPTRCGVRTSLELRVEVQDHSPSFVITEHVSPTESVEFRSTTASGAWLRLFERLKETTGASLYDYATVLKRLSDEHDLHLHLSVAIQEANCEPHILDADETEYSLFFKDATPQDCPTTNGHASLQAFSGHVDHSLTPRQLESEHLCSLGMDLFGLGQAWVCRELEYFVNDLHQCRQFLFSHNTQHRSRVMPLPVNRTGCARSEPLAKRQKRLGFRMQSALAGDDQGAVQENTSLSRSRNSSSTTVLTGSPMMPYAMQYRILKASPTKIRVGRSKIQGFGVFAIDNIARGEMFVEYIGEIIRQSVADLREKRYEAKGVGCYMFRLTNDQILDATFTGNIARFINHSCEPSAGTRKIQVGGEYKIVIYALRDIRMGEEVCYDYKFPIEEEKIPCHCGAQRCRGTMN